MAAEPPKKVRRRLTFLCFMALFFCGISFFTLRWTRPFLDTKKNKSFSSNLPPTEWRNPVGLKKLLAARSMGEMLELLSPKDLKEKRGFENSENLMIKERDMVEVQRRSWVLPEVMYFMHIPKTAGFTLNTLLRSMLSQLRQENNLTSPPGRHSRKCEHYCSCRNVFGIFILPCYFPLALVIALLLTPPPRFLFLIFLRNGTCSESRIDL